MKKNFTDTAAAAFISKPTAAPTATPAAITDPAAPEQGGKEPEMLIMFRKPKCNPGEEARTLRKQLLMRPSVFAAINTYAQAHRLSFNGIAELAIEYYMQTHDKTGKPRG